MKDIFKEIYHQHIWFDPESRSGPGSNVAQTSTVREILSTVIRDFQVTTLLDIPCGDFNWMKEVDLSHCMYYGCDIVDEVIGRNQEQYAAPARQFACADITQSPLPQVDLIFCRDCLVHFSNADIKKAISNIKKSKGKFLLTTTFTTWLNSNIRTGSWRPLNVQAYPFLFPIPLRVMEENCTEINGAYTDKSLALWKVDSLPDLSSI